MAIQDLDPLFAANDAGKPLIHRLLAVPEYRSRYLGYVREIAVKWLDWDRLGPVANRLHESIRPQVLADTRKLDSNEEFESSVEGKRASEGAAAGPGRPAISIREFATQRRAYLLSKIPATSGGVSE